MFLNSNSPELEAWITAGIWTEVMVHPEVATMEVTMVVTKVVTTVVTMVVTMVETVEATPTVELEERRQRSLLET